MKKKIFALFLVLALAGPWLGFLCSCCPMAHAGSAEVSVISDGDCDSCCPERITIDEKRQALQGFGKSLQVSSLRWISQSVAFVTGIRFASFKPSHRAADMGLPVSSKTPLYLSLQILRI